MQAPQRGTIVWFFEGKVFHCRNSKQIHGEAALSQQEHGIINMPIRKESMASGVGEGKIRLGKPRATPLSQEAGAWEHAEKLVLHYLQQDQL